MRQPAVGRGLEQEPVAVLLRQRIELSAAPSVGVIGPAGGSV